MKNLREQIEFIDKKLIVLYGFSGIIDYSHSINITDIETIKLDLIKINELIPEFRNIFHVKNFNLHKTDYKIKTEIQAICLLKTSLEVTSIPFDISLKKNKRILRLISKNNILEDYINNKKMSDIRNLRIKEDNESNLFSLTNKPELTNLISQDYLPINSIKNDINSVNLTTAPLIKENKGYKQEEKYEVITKEMLNKSIKSTLQYNFSIGLNKEYVKMYKLNEPVIRFDLSKYEISNKSIKNCVISIKPKIINGKPLISQEFIDTILSDITYKIYIKSLIYENKFVNNKDIIISDIIILNKCLFTDYSTIVELCDINKIINYLDMLEIQFNITHVKFYIEMENKLTKKNLINQEIEHNGLFNNLRIYDGGASPSYTRYLSKDEISNLYRVLERKYLDEELEKSGAKLYKCISIPQLNGLEIYNYNKDLFKLCEHGHITKKYDYITWKDTFDIDVIFLPYYKIIENKNTFIHCYDISIDGKHDTIREISIKFSDFTYKTLYIGTTNQDLKNGDIQIEFIDCFTQDIIKGDDISNCKYITFPDEQNVINQLFNSEEIHLYTDGNVRSLRLKIKSSSADSPIKNNITFVARYYSWNNDNSYSYFKDYYKNNSFICPNKIIKE